MKVTEIIAAIRELEDHEIGAVIASCQAEARRRKPTPRVGDTVVFNSKARPKYLQGTQATVTKINEKTVVVSIGPEGGRFANQDGVLAPKGIVDLKAA